MAVKSNVRRNLIGSQMMQANVQNLWRPVVPEETAAALQETAGVIAQQHKEQEKAAFERLSLEAAKMQQEELEQIKLATTADVISALEADFQNKLKQQFAADKWGKKWLEKRGDVFFSGHSVDVARARAAKEEELTILETDKVLKSFADEAALTARREEQSARARERRMQDAVLAIREKYGKNAILKAMSLRDGATARQRNEQIGGHKA